MRYLSRWFLLLVAFIPLPVEAQRITGISPKDSLRIAALEDSIGYHFFQKPDSTVFFAEQLREFAREVGDNRHVIIAMQMGGEGYRNLGDFPKSLDLQLKSLRLSRKYGETQLGAVSGSFIGFTYLQAGLGRQALNYILPAAEVLRNGDDTTHASFNLSNAAACYLQLGLLDSARYYIDRSLLLFKAANDSDARKKALRTLIFSRIGRLYEQVGLTDSAKAYYRLCADFAQQDNVRVNVGVGNKELAKMFMLERRYDSSLNYARKAFEVSERTKSRPNYVESAQLLSDAYRQLGYQDSALYYLTLAVKEKDSIFGPEKFREMQVLMAEEQDQHQAMETERIETRNRQRMFLMGGAIAALLLLAVILRRNNKIKQALNKQLTDQKASLESTLETLRSTQKQLVQSEKMASLGELTAGIAHEIQNPLNFVNNFSDLNRDMIDELQEALKNGDMREASLLAENIRENEAKINLHGKRADGIVKSMLQHSRSSTGVKEPTDVNRLIEEYVRLAYHGYRARQKDFNVKLDLDLDPAAGRVNMVAQDIGRVLLNLLNNAFYAVQEKAKRAGEGYEPMVTILTRRNHTASNIGHPESVIIEIRDNGPGIPDAVKEKIFQPFFTTKPTGQGTGLGLSLSYDIVTKGNGGTLEVDSRASEGTRFTVWLPSS